MNDWYLDPPNEPEVPECCGDETVLFPDGVCVCEHCGLRYAPVPDPYDGYEPPDVELPEHGCCACGTPTPYVYCDKCAETVKCAHGNKPGECGVCDYEEDLAYTASRER